MKRTTRRLIKECYIVPPCPQIGAQGIPDLEKLVKSVTKECIAVVQNELQGDDEISSEWVYKKIVHPIKKHFGIE